MKIIKKLTSAALATCMAFSLTSAAQTVNSEEANSALTDDLTFVDNTNNAIENGIVHWSDILGYGLETVQKKLEENPSVMIANEHDEDDYHDYRGTATKEELIEAGLWSPYLETSRKKLTSEEASFILQRLLEVKEPEDEYMFDHGDIYLDTRWRGVTVSSEGFPGYMPNEDSNDFFNLSLDENDRVKVSTPSIAPPKYVAEILVLYETSPGIYKVDGGTAFFVDKDILLSAAHCLCDKEYGLPDIVQIFPGGFESGIDRIDAYTVYVKQDNDQGCSPNDYSVICLDSNGSDGYFGLSTTSNTNLTSKEVYLYGFPNDKPVSTNKYHYEFWISHGYTGSSPQSGYLFHTAYAVPGCSGAPIILKSNKSVIGIHSGSYYGDLYAVRITSNLIQFVNKYR